MTVPPAPFRCPPGPYERACQIAWYLKTKKPQAKLIVLDANNDVVSKTALFKAAFRNYPNLDYRPTSKVERVDLSAREVVPAIGERVRYDVLNLIPPQRAGAIAIQAGLADAGNRWCEVNHVTFESAKRPGIHVIGDATTGLPVPKSGNIANATGKICATAVVHLLNGKQPPVLAARQHLLQLGQRPRGHRRRQRIPDRQRQGRPDRAEAHPARLGLGRAELDRVADQHLERHPWLAGGGGAG